MWQTLFEIPTDILGYPLFGPRGLVLVAFLIAAGLFLAVQFRRYGWTTDVTTHALLFAVVAGAIVFVLPQLAKDHEGRHVILIRGYGVMLLLAIVAGVGLAVYRARRMGVDPEIIYSLAFYCFIFGIVGARLFFVIQKWEMFFHDSGKGTFETLAATIKAILDVTEGGLVVYGSLIGALVALVLFVRRRRLPGLALCDLIAPSLVLGLALGRIGCLMNGCCYGDVCSHDWAIVFPPQSVPYESQLRTGQFFGFRLEDDDSSEPLIVAVRPGTVAARAGLKAGDVIRRINDRSVSEVKDPRGRPVPALAAAQQYLADSGRVVALTVGDGRRVVLELDRLPDRSLAIHPTQIYSSINALLLCGLLLAYYPFRRRDGEVIALLLTLYPISRILLEFIRNDEGSQFGTGLTISQNVSLLVLVGVVVLWFYVLRQPGGTAWPPADAANRSVNRDPEEAAA